jgi:aminopeptidase-like protein
VPLTKNKQATMMEIIQALLLKNRTVVSADVNECMDYLAAQLPLDIHKYPSGKDFGTWVVPPEWNPKKAELRADGKVLASYEDHPLFLATYSKSFSGKVTKEELLKHVHTSEAVPDAYLYEFRLAMDFQRRLKEWRISLPHNLVQSLEDREYDVEIEVETKPGNMLVGEHRIEGQSKHTFTFLTHLCHPGQANDGLAGVAVGVEVMRRLRKEFPNPKYTYQLLVLPETVGSCVYLADMDEKRYEDYLGSIFIEMIGTTHPLRYGVTCRGNTYLDRVMSSLVKLRKEGSVCELRDHWGNDELVFDSPGVRIPGGEIGRYPFRYYHTSKDDLSVTHEESLEEACELMLELARTFERDFIPQPKQKVPVYLTRYNLYADWERERELHEANRAIIDLMYAGVSVFDIAAKVGLPHKQVVDYIHRWKEHGLIEENPLTPEYFRAALPERAR